MTDPLRDVLAAALRNVENWLEKGVGIPADEVEGWPLVKRLAQQGVTLTREPGLDVPMGVWTCASPTQPDATVVAYTRPILLRATRDRRTSVVISGYQWDFAALASDDTP